jgi:hypothetical protein
VSRRNTVTRSMHDLGAAAWFGGSLMGALGVNGAAASVADPTERAKVAAVGWGKWAPVNALAIGAHLLGGTGVLVANRGRAAHQAGVRANTITKLVVTAAALGTTAYSGILGREAAKGDGHPVAGATEPSATTPIDVAKAQSQLKVLQWVTPVLTGIVVVLGAQQGEQQRPTEILTGLATHLGRRVIR